MKLKIRLEKEVLKSDPIEALSHIERMVKEKLISINITELEKMDRALGLTRTYFDSYNIVEPYVSDMKVPFPEIKDTPEDSEGITMVFPLEVNTTPLPRYQFREPRYQFKEVK